MPRFSVVVPAYNAQATLSETLDAVLAQRLGDWECIVVDDGSADETRAIALAYAEGEPRLRVITQANQGSAGAYNTGVGAATGDFVVLCSADDILLPEHLAEMTAFIDREPGFDIYSSNGYYLKSDGSRELVYAPGEISDSMSLTAVIRNCFFSVGATYRRPLFSVVNGYRTDVFGEDYDFWLRSMAAGAKHRYLPAALSLHRLSPSQKSSNLESAYRSDIRLLTDLLASANLSPDERRAVRESVRRRERMIAQLKGHPVRRGLRESLLRLARRVLGKNGLRRLLRVSKGRTD